MLQGSSRLNGIVKVTKLWPNLTTMNFDSSAYCGGLWLASLRVMQEIATILGFPDEATKYTKILNNGKKAYHSLLWNGKMLLVFICYSKGSFQFAR